MDGIVLAFFLFAAFAGGFASGLAGFALGFVVSGIWLHILTPVQTTVLIVGYGLLTQGYGVWKLRDALTWRSIAPFIIGGMIGVPIGTILLTYLNPAYLRTGVGVLLVIYGTYGLAQPTLKPLPSNRLIDAGIELANGVLAGLTGLPGFIITVWCQLRGWKKDVQLCGVRFFSFEPLLTSYRMCTPQSQQSFILFHNRLPMAHRLMCWPSLVLRNLDNYNAELLKGMKRYLVRSMLFQALRTS